MATKKTLKHEPLARERKLIRGLRKQEDRLQRDPRATAEYWNGDDWGSISGQRDASEWVERKLAEWLHRQLEKGT